MARKMPAVSSARRLTYEELADWLNDTVRHLRRFVDETRLSYHRATARSNGQTRRSEQSTPMGLHHGVDPVPGAE